MKKTTYTASTQNSTSSKHPETLYVSGRHVYHANDVFNVNHDGALLAKDAWECKKYVRGDVHDELVKSLERQASNMAFILNHADTGKFYDKFKEELEADRAALVKAGA